MRPFSRSAKQASLFSLAQSNGCFLVSVVYCVQRYDMPPSRGNDLHGKATGRRALLGNGSPQLHECTRSSGYGGSRLSAADAPDAA